MGMSLFVLQVSLHDDIPVFVIYVNTGSNSRGEYNAVTSSKILPHKTTNTKLRNVHTFPLKAHFFGLHATQNNIHEH